MSDEKPNGWYAKIVEGVWRQPTMLGVPPQMLLIPTPLVMLSFFDIRLIVVPTLIQALMMVATKWDPEWPDTIEDWLKIPGEIEP